MALIETEQKPNITPLRTVNEMVRALRGAVADEMSAQNLYSSMIDDLKAGNQDKTIIERIEEIMHDEENHAGSLLWVISKLDKSVTDNMAHGANGE